MTARFDRAWAKASRANLGASVGFLLALSAAQSASAAPATREQGRTRTPNVLRPRGILKLRAITNWLRRQKAGLSEARRAVFEQ
jgi:hypothetical protein